MKQFSEGLATAWYGSGGFGPPYPPTFGSEGTGEIDHLSQRSPDVGKLIGAILAGRYRIESVIGMGGFATVCSAWDLGLKRWVAVKVYQSLPLGHLASAEVQLQAACQHPNVMPLYDAGSDPLHGITYLVMPLYPGADLAAMLEHYGPMPYRTALLCADQICNALEYLWQRRQVPHGDIKPANIWLTQGGSALLMDFNLQGLLASEGGLRVGTPGFTAPEALAGRRDRAADVFSLGCVLYQCLSGQPPFSDHVAAQRGQFIPLSRLRPDIRPDLEAVVHTALASSLDRRFQTAREFQTALRRPARSYRPPFLTFLLRSLGRSLRPVLRAAGWTLGRLYRQLSRWLRRFCRHAWRHPLQAMVEMVLIWIAINALYNAIIHWLRAHQREILLPLAGMVALAFGKVWWRWRRFRRQGSQ